MFNNVHTTPPPALLSTQAPQDSSFIHTSLSRHMASGWIVSSSTHHPISGKSYPRDHFYLYLLNSSSPSKFIWIPPISCHMLFSPFIHDSPDHHILSSPQPWGQHRCKQQVLHTWLINEGINDNLLLGSMAYIPHISKS